MNASWLLGVSHLSLAVNSSINFLIYFSIGKVLYLLIIVLSSLFLLLLYFYSYLSFWNTLSTSNVLSTLRNISSGSTGNPPIEIQTNNHSRVITSFHFLFNHHCIDNQRFKGAVYRLRDNFEMKLKRRNTERTVIDESCEDNGQKLEQASFSNLVQKEMEDGVKMEHKDGNN